jgi:hypothetical protein
MLIVLNKKIKCFYKCKQEDIPPAVFSQQGMKDKLYMQFYLYDEDYKNNVNVKPEIINVKSIKCVSVFDYEERYKGTQGREYLQGSNSKITFNDNSVIYVVETVSDIASKTSAII